MPFFTFDQNNSFGRFLITDNLDQMTIVEAPDADTANTRFVALGGYFNGVRTGDDCPCCGDRFYPVSPHHADPEPTVFGRSALDPENRYATKIHYLDGRVVKLNQ